MILSDLLKPNLNVVFCGTAVGNKSATKKAYYAGNGNKFYSILAKTGLTPQVLMPKEFEQLLDYKIGLTDLSKNKSGNDNALFTSDFDTHALIQNIEKFQPKILCFNGKAAASVFKYGRPNRTGEIDYGYMKETIGVTKIFTAPSTSSSANKYWDETYWFMLKETIS